MKCPLCVDAVLDVTHHGGIEIDICPRCRGVWLDRGELQRLLTEPAPVDRGGRSRDDWSRDESRSSDRYGDGRARDDGRSRKKRRFADRLSDVFDEVLDF